MRRLYRISRWIHKYIGLAILLFALWMSISGILLNHPTLISGISVPSYLVPPDYTVKNWNRSAIICGVYDPDNQDRIFIAGKKGLWVSEDGGVEWRRSKTGLPNSDYYGKAYSLYLEPRTRTLFAGLEGGLFKTRLDDLQWQRVQPELIHHPVKKLIATKSLLVVVTNSGAYSRPLLNSDAEFRKAKLRKKNTDTITLVRLFFDLHSGKAWGLLGQLLFDVAGLVIIFLSISAFYIWYLPKKNKAGQVSEDQKKQRRKKFLFYAENHNALGIWFVLILLIMGFTGIFMRPPLLAVIANGSVQSWSYPSPIKPDQWDHKIHNAVYDSSEDSMILSTTEGLLQGKADFSEEFVKLDNDVPIFVMGATVMEEIEKGLLYGSFNGIYLDEKKSGKVIDISTGQTVDHKISNVRPSELMVTGVVRSPAGEIAVFGHEKGMVTLDNSAFEKWIMPKALEKQPGISLWNYMFELHNGRIFKDLIGNWYILLVPLGSILFTLTIITGLIDWIYIKLKKSK